jgi:hypothetical protein
MTWLALIPSVLGITDKVIPDLAQGSPIATPGTSSTAPLGRKFWKGGMA